MFDIQKQETAPVIYVVFWGDRYATSEISFSEAFKKLSGYLEIEENEHITPDVCAYVLGNKYNLKTWNILFEFVE